MMSTVRFNPFRITDPDLFGEVLRNSLFRSTATENVCQEKRIRMDVREDESSYLVSAEIPGARKEEIHVSIEGNQVSIDVGSIQGIDSDGRKMIHSERDYGRIIRRFLLESEVDETLSSAKYTDGILELTLPKKIAVSAKKIVVS